MPPDQLRRWIAGFVVGVVVAAGLTHWLAGGQRFDSATWKTAGLSETSRTGMVDDLLQRYELVGASREYIKGLLGAPTETAYFSNYDYVYWLGSERGYTSIDSEWLCIKFADGAVVEVRLLRD